MKQIMTLLGAGVLVLSVACSDDKSSADTSDIDADADSDADADTDTDADTDSDTDADTDSDTDANGDAFCASGFTCTDQPASDVVWVMKNDGNVNGPNCRSVCEQALSGRNVYHACDEGRPVEATDIASFEDVAASLGFTCRPGGCWDSVAPGEGMIMVSIDVDAADGSRTCYFPEQTTHSCLTDPGNANCFGERYATVCPCVVKPLEEACEWECPPNNATVATWNTEGTSCLERINYWRKKACEDGWVECPPAGLPPMVECTACHECANSQAQYDSTNGAHSSFTRCGEFVQGEGGGATCADVIDSFVSERAPDAEGIIRCEGHCGPIVAHGCQTFHWGKAADSNFHTLNWGNCDATTCQNYCTDNAADCFTVETSPSMTCEN